MAVLNMTQSELVNNILQLFLLFQHYNSACKFSHYSFVLLHFMTSVVSVLVKNKSNIQKYSYFYKILDFFFLIHFSSFALFLIINQTMNPRRAFITNVLTVSGPYRDCQSKSEPVTSPAHSIYELQLKSSLYLAMRGTFG